MRFKILAALLAATLTALAQDDAPEKRSLSLQDCIAIALDNNFDIQISRYNPMIAGYNLSGIYGAYEPVLAFSGEHEYSQSPGGVDDQGRPYTGTETETDRLNGGISGLLPWGLTYTLGGSMANQDITRTSFVVDPTSGSVVTNSFLDINSGNTISYLSTNFNATIGQRSSFEVTSGSLGFLELRQPLLKNFWIDGTRLSISISRTALKRSEADFRDQVMDTITGVENAYLELIHADENVKVQEKALELAERSLAENKRRVEVGALAPLDEKQAQSQVSSSRADLLSAQANRETLERVLKDLLSDDYTNEWATVTIAPMDKLIAVPQHYDLQESWRRGLAHGPLYKVQQTRLSLDEQKQRVRYQRNQLFPQLDVVGTYGFSGTGREYSDALDQINRGENPFWSFGAQLSIPLGQTSARNNLKAAKATQEQLELVLKQGEQKTLVLIENDIANARSSFERVDATRQARLYAEAALEAEQKKLENGKSTSFVVLQLQRDLTNARSAEIRALADYNIALSRLAFHEGSTLDRRKVNLEIK